MLACLPARLVACLQAMVLLDNGGFLTQLHRCASLHNLLNAGRGMPPATRVTFDPDAWPWPLALTHDLWPCVVQAL